MVHVHVRYLNNGYDVVNDTALDELITAQRIKEFYRPSERRWVTPGKDPVRGYGGVYAGPERRQRDPRDATCAADGSGLLAS